MAAGASRPAFRNARKFREGLVAELIAWAEIEFRRTRRLQDGATEGEHGQAAARIRAKLGGKPLPSKTRQADRSKRPELLAYLWGHFCELLSGVPVSGMGPAVISWADVAHWSALTGEQLEHWEARALITLSARRAEIVSEAEAPRARSNQDRAD